ncbi:hypothetical protein SCHPADRAFT_888257 [Schizopora paradoxa]|uniref:Uncharacterized protein n=1 Tax=Schizopora paradoxa TaxID=27342 RepID=A0A0H2RW47_9AGAM|nr:hypothetical protein SCHPADRAFT_888257 [Schizopora paradoxa]
MLLFARPTPSDIHHLGTSLLLCTSVNASATEAEVFRCQDVEWEGEESSKELRSGEYFDRYHDDYYIVVFEKEQRHFEFETSLDIWRGEVEIQLMNGDEKMTTIGLDEGEAPSEVDLASETMRKKRKR